MALVYLFTPSTDVYSCPLAMTDGAARTLSVSANAALRERALPRLTSRDPRQFWTSGQWMTESTGGSDVGLSETVARQDEQGGWQLYGRKWFTSAATSQMALTLARPEGNPAGGKGLALFYLETRDSQGRLDRILVHRLKDKLGTRKVPTAELTLDGALAQPVMGLNDGVKNICAHAQRHAHVEQREQCRVHAPCRSPRPRLCAPALRLRCDAGGEAAAPGHPRRECRPSSRRRSISPSSWSS